MFQRLWPRIANREDARRIAGSAVKWYVILAVFSAAFGIVSLVSGEPITRSPSDARIVASAWSLVDAAIFGFIAYKIGSLSLSWSIAGLGLAVLSMLLALGSGDLSPIALIVEFYIVLRFVNAVRAALAWRKFNAPAPVAGLEITPQ